MAATGNGPRPPGWYPDPSGSRAWRWWDGYRWTWWDGYRWTEYASDPSPGGPTGPAQPMPTAPRGYPGGVLAPPSRYDLFAAEARAAPWARRALFGYLAIVIIAMIAAWADGPTVRSIFDLVRTQSQTGVVGIQSTQSVRLDWVSLLLLVAEAPVFIVLLTFDAGRPRRRGSSSSRPSSPRGSAPAAGSSRSSTFGSRTSRSGTAFLREIRSAAPWRGCGRASSP